jgi:hypothetical protein
MYIEIFVIGILGTLFKMTVFKTVNGNFIFSLLKEKSAFINLYKGRLL